MPLNPNRSKTTKRSAELERPAPNGVALAEAQKFGPNRRVRTDSAPIEANKSGQPTAADGAAEKPLVWGLTTHDADERNQILNLTRALHWPFKEKPLRFNRLSGLPNLILAASPMSLDLAGTPDLRPPWPDFLISSGRHSVPVARWIRRCSGGRSRLIHIGCPRAPLGLFDLVITTRQHALPPRRNVLVNPMSLNWIAPEQLCEAAGLWSDRLVNLPRPRIAVLIDGSTPRGVRKKEFTRRLAREVADQAFRSGGSLMITAGRVTPPDILRLVLDSIPPDVPLDAWLGEGDNLYHAYLAFADRIVVAGSNAATLSEVCTTGKAVEVFEPSVRTGLRSRKVGAFRNLAGQKGPFWLFFSAIHDRLLEIGVIAPSPRNRLFRENLVAQGLAAPFGAIDQVPVSVHTMNLSIGRYGVCARCGLTEDQYHI